MHTRQYVAQTRAHGHGGYLSPLLKIVLAWLAAAALAIGHHLFNASLNGRIVPTTGSRLHGIQSQAGASAIGTTFAFLVSALLGVSAGTAFLQCAWRLVRQRSFTVAGLDALWSSPHNPLAFLSIDFWKTGRGLVVIATLSWAFPLVVTFAPGTLGVETQINTASEECVVQTYDLELSTALHEELGNALQSYTQPSVLANRTVAATLFGGQPFSPTSPCSGNCSYLLSVNAPSFSCSPGVQNSSTLTWISTSIHTPLYVADTFDASPSLNPYLGWDFVGHYADYSAFIPVSTGDTIPQGINFTCIAYNSTYHLNYTFLGSIPHVSIDQIVRDKPASQISPPTTAGENSTFNENSGTHSAWFNATTNTYALVSSMYNYIIGNATMEESIESAKFVFAPPTLSVTQTNLVSSVNSNGDIGWADVPSATTNTNCSSTNLVPHFAYNARRLWLVYGLGLGLSMLCAIVGIVALFQNEFGATGSFSDFLAATRNAELNDLDLGKHVRLRYGPLKNGGGRYAFAQPENLGGNRPVPWHGNVDVGEEETVFLPESLYAGVVR
ncbi:hypothetical protein MSAN_01193700 [Mycena sanguinolenta]|uniref:Uncharacterized protein n=1 Tax=Mycena sanguinolenta TaxID=230812 RepID=A0A8H6YNQ4_9AGAR|nr:hypothetical protein MSAN_01193700 [Mycena sanguinolenta]